MNKYRDFRRRGDRNPNLASTARQQNGSIKIRLVQAAAINIPIKADHASPGRLENVSSLSLCSMNIERCYQGIRREKFSNIFFLTILPVHLWPYVSPFRNDLADRRVTVDGSSVLPSYQRRIVPRPSALFLRFSCGPLPFIKTTDVDSPWTR